jgi:hypothetical protein
MKPSIQLPPTEDSHSESFHYRLNAYALAAGAAGVSLLALAQPGEARIIHQHLGVPLQGNQVYPFNPANQGVVPFYFLGSFLNRTLVWWNRVFLRPNTAFAGALLAKNGFAADLPAGAVIGGGGVFGEGASYGLLFTYGPYGGGTRKHHKGNFAFGQTDYLGFKFNIAGKAHFGWVRLKVSVRPLPGEKVTVAYLRDYAYETIPGKSIRAGQTKEGVEGVFDPELAKALDSVPGARSAASISGNRHSASLGVLALGASGMPPDGVGAAQ